MPRYTTQPRAVMHPSTDGEYEGNSYSWNPVNVDGARHVDTGLLDAAGNAIYRTQAPVGFGRMEEW